MHFTVQSGKAGGKLSKIVGNLKKHLRRAMNFRGMQMLREGYGAGAATNALERLLVVCAATMAADRR
jgi:hypothetical protein